MADRYFEAQADFWEDIYRASSVYSEIHRHRLGVALAWVEELDLPSGALALDVGCGAGLATAALAERDLSVYATDAEPEMIRLTEQRARSLNLGGVRTEIADVQSLPFETGMFDLVLALGVLPWVDSPGRAVAEMARVTSPGGALILNVDNVARLHYRFDPRYNPRLAWARTLLKRALKRERLRPASGPQASSSMFSPWEFDQVLMAAGVDKLAGRAYGFGPFTFLGRSVMGERIGLRLHHRLQAMADRGVGGVRRGAAQYIVLGRKPSDPRP